MIDSELTTMYLRLLNYFVEQRRWAKLSPEETRRRQTVKFRQLFEHAREHSPFYRQIYREAGVDKLEIRSFEDIQRVPIVDKAMMRGYPPEEIMTRPIDSQLVKITTSGSTGEPFQIFQNKYEQYTSHLRVLGMLLRLGYRPWDRILMLTRLDPNAVMPVEKDLAIVPRLRRSLNLFRREIISIYSQPEEIVRWLDARRGAKVFWSTPGIVAILCDYLQRHEIRYDFPLTVLTSETLSDSERQRYAHYLGGRVISHYGTMECPTIGFDDGVSVAKRIFANSCLMELVDQHEENGSRRGTPVITNLVNWTMPFIRYNTHDLATAIDSPDCPTKAIGPICGRFDDVITLPSGEKFAHHHAHASFMDFAECLQFKFVQYPTGEVALRLRIGPDTDQIAVQERALERWRKRYPHEPLTIEFVETMPIDAKTGKFKNIERIHV